MSAPSPTPRQPQDDCERSADTPAAMFHGHSAAEWVTLAISLLIIIGLVGLVVALASNGGSAPPRFTMSPLLDQVRHEAEAYYVPIAVTNLGGVTAQEVRVVGELSSPDDESETAEFTIDVLAGGESHEGTMIFRSEPTARSLSVHVESFR